MKSISIHMDFFEVIREHTDEEIGLFFRAMAADIDQSERPHLPPTLEMLKKLVDSQNRRFSERQATNGSKGGRPPKAQASQAETAENHNPINPAKPKKAPEPITNPGTNANTKPRTQAPTKAEGLSLSRVDGPAKASPLQGMSVYAEIIGHLNAVCGTAYNPAAKSTREHINARLKEGFTAADFKTVTEKKFLEWGNNPTMMQYLRPQTLFGTKFESYLNQPWTDGRKLSATDLALIKFAISDKEIDTHSAIIEPCPTSGATKRIEYHDAS